MYVCMYLSTYVCVCFCMCVCVYVCVHACMHACMYTSIFCISYGYLSICLSSCLSIRIYIYIYVCMRIHKYMCIYIYIYVYEYLHLPTCMKDRKQRQQQGSVFKLDPVGSWAEHGTSQVQEASAPCTAAPAATCDQLPGLWGIAIWEFPKIKGPDIDPKSGLGRCGPMRKHAS